MSNDAMFGREFVVRGRVQGVGFRAATQREALRLGLCGCADNLPDGAVRVRAFGNELALNALTQWLATGPRFARIDALTQLKIEGVDPALVGFSTGTER